MFHAAPLTLGDVSRTVSRNDPSVISNRMLRIFGPRGSRSEPPCDHGPARNDSARSGEAVRAQVFTVGILPYASGPVKMETRILVPVGGGLCRARGGCGHRRLRLECTASWATRPRRGWNQR